MLGPFLVIFHYNCRPFQKAIIVYGNSFFKNKKHLIEHLIMMIYVILRNQVTGKIMKLMENSLEEKYSKLLIENFTKDNNLCDLSKYFLSLFINISRQKMLLYEIRGMRHNNQINVKSSIRRKFSFLLLQPLTRSIGEIRNGLTDYVFNPLVRICFFGGSFPVNSYSNCQTIF